MDEEFLNEIWAQFELEAVEHSKNSEDILLESVNNKLSKDQIDKLFRNSLGKLFGKPLKANFC